MKRGLSYKTTLEKCSSAKLLQPIFSPRAIRHEHLPPMSQTLTRTVMLRTTHGHKIVLQKVPRISATAGYREPRLPFTQGGEAYHFF